MGKDVKIWEAIASLMEENSPGHIENLMTALDHIYLKDEIRMKIRPMRHLLASRLFNSADLFRQQKQLVKATVSKVDQNIMRGKLRKVFTNNAGDLLPKNALGEEKNRVEACNDVYYAKK